MWKAICAVLVLTVALTAAPAAYATQLQAGGEELEVSSPLDLSSSNLQLETVAGVVECSETKLSTQVLSNQEETDETVVVGGFFSGCEISGLAVDVTTNASAENPWIFQFQEPEESGSFATHLVAPEGIQIAAEIQFEGVPIATCDYVAEAIQLEGEAGLSLLEIGGSGQFAAELGSELCGESASLSGEFILESEEEPATVGPDKKVKLCSEKDAKCTALEKGSFKAALSGTTSFSGVGVTCSKSELQGETTEKEGSPLRGKITVLSFDTCNSGACTVEVLAPLGGSYWVNIYGTNAGNGTLFFGLGTVEINCGGNKNCRYAGTGYPRLRIEGGKPTATMYAENVTLKLASGGKECDTLSLWTGTYPVSTPAPLFVIAV